MCRIYSDTLNELDAYQDQYDTKTDFSRDVTAQKQWNAQIEAALKKMPK